MSKLMNAFDELAKLSHDPDAFEIRRLELVEEIMQDLDESERTRAKAQQWNIEYELAKHPDPIDRRNAMVVMFWEGVGRFKSALDGEITPPKNNVYTFKRKNK